MSAAASTSQVLAFRAGGRKFGIPAERVREVARLPILTSVPQSPDSLLGIGNIRGEAMAVVSVSRLLGMPQGSENQLLVFEGDQPTALAIDRIEGIVDAVDEYEQPAFADLLLKAFPGKIAASARVRASTRQADMASDQRLALLSFAVADQLFALPLEQIESVLRVPAEITHFPQGDKATVGSIDWRDHVVPLFSLAALLDLPRSDGDSTHILIVRLGSHDFGLLVDRIDALLRPSITTVDAVPLALLRGEAEAVIHSIHRPAGGGRLVSILAVDQLFSETMTLRLKESSPVAHEAEQHAQVEIETLLLIESAGQRFAFPLDEIHQIASVPASFTPLVRVPDYLVGLTSFRGEALPVVDLSAHLSKRPTKGQKARLLIVDIAGSEAALLVDGVEGIVHARKEALAPIPSTGDARTSAFGRVIRLDAGEAVTLVLAPDELFAQVEANLISAIALGTAESA